MLKTQIIGRLTKNPVKSEKLDNLVNFGVAVDMSYKNKEGVKVEDVEFVNCQAWGKTGELIMQYMHKGEMHYFEGVTRTKKVGEGDEAKYFTSTTVNKFEFLPNGKKDGVKTESTEASNAEADNLLF